MKWFKNIKKRWIPLKWLVFELFWSFLRSHPRYGFCSLWLLTLNRYLEREQKDRKIQTNNQFDCCFFWVDATCIVYIDPQRTRRVSIANMRVLWEGVNYKKIQVASFSTTFFLFSFIIINQRKWKRVMNEWMNEWMMVMMVLLWVWIVLLFFLSNDRSGAQQPRLRKSYLYLVSFFTFLGNPNIFCWFFDRCIAR